MPHTCLVINPGSSTLKLAVYDGNQLVSSTQIEVAQQSRVGQGSDESQHAVALRAFQAKSPSLVPDVVAYRVVHGGKNLSAPTLITPDVIYQLRESIGLAPLHLPQTIAAIEASMLCFENAKHVACFDTAFHASLPDNEKRLPIPRHFYDLGIRRYGFHGLSYESIATQLPDVSMRAARGRTIVCHLGNGASVCGMIECKSQTTSMGFTPMDGLIMGTRSGRLDPGLLLHWLRQGSSVEVVESIVTKQSGLLGISALSSDMRTLLEAADTNLAAAQAIEMFCSAVAREIAMAATAIQGIDAIVFTAGIGEHCSVIRHRIVKELDWLGAKFCEDSNRRNCAKLHTEDSSFEILRLCTDEQQVIADHARHLADML